MSSHPLIPAPLKARGGSCNFRLPRAEGGPPLRPAAFGFFAGVRVVHKANVQLAFCHCWWVTGLAVFLGVMTTVATANYFVNSLQRVLAPGGVTNVLSFIAGLPLRVRHSTSLARGDLALLTEQRSHDRRRS
ncbi:hypothetical protein MKZ38_009163 [Zalerion maritima]|uniref:Uncharacterized protein n=1 Tax=Zalerion maritima TaxID=339359 RepID=A0AAD5RHC8_9PEZI|nr:hypothetical protein MKZ38_009163 [Zalerion maritima]